MFTILGILDCRNPNESYILAKWMIINMHETYSHVGIIDIKDLAWHIQILCLCVKLNTSLQKPNIGIKDTELTYMEVMMGAYIYLIKASFWIYSLLSFYT